MKELPKEVRWALLEANYQTLPPVVLSFPLIGWFVTRVLSRAGIAWLGTWQIALVTATLSSLGLCWAFRHAHRRHYSLWSSLRALSACLNGITFGMAGLCLMAPDQPSLQLYLFVVILGGAAASVSSSSSHLPSLFMYLTWSLMPISLHAFGSTDAALVGLGELVPILWAVMLGIGLRSYTMQRRSALYAHQNRQLVSQLQRAQSELKEANDGLNTKVAERTLELSRFKVLLDASSEGILIASAHDLKILDWNQAAVRLLSLQISTPPALTEIKPLADIPWLQHSREGSLLRLEASSQQPIEVSGICQSFDGERYLVLVVRDASERLKLEKQLLSAQKTEVVGQLAGGIAHDFNNMLTVVLGISECLRDSFDAKDSRRQDVSDILDAGERAKELTGKLLRLSRSKLDTPELMDLNACIQDLSSMLRRSLAGGIELVVLLHDFSSIVRMVPGDLDQILLNLAVNASDAMPQGGTLTIELRDDLPVPDCLGPGPYACIRVKDTGVGMEPEILARAFEPFYSTKGVKGHGLGLAVTDSIVRRASGLLQADSHPGRGTSFHIWLPLVSEAVAPRLESSGAIKLPSRGTRILLVEDQDALRSLLQKQLSLQGYQVTAARSCEEALALTEDSFDLLLSDIVLPGMSGVDLARRMAARVPRILLMSGYADQAPSLDGKALPLLNKPFTTRELSKRLIQVLGAAR